MATSSQQLTEAQSELIADLDDVAEHVQWEFDADKYQGFSTCGFAHVGNISGNGSFVRRVQSLAKSDDVRVTKRGRQDDTYTIDVAGLELSLMKDDYRGGYRLSINNVRSFVSGAEYQRMDVRERLHDLLLERLQYNGYCDDARRYSRMD